MAVPKDYEDSLDPRARAIIEFLRDNTEKGQTVMDIYGGIYSEDEKSAHLRESAGVKEVFQEIQRWLDEFRQQGHVKSKMVSTSILFSLVE